jgi:glycosyltransferase involved in cell wall biosynthesis
MRILMIAPQPFLEPRGTPISVYQRIKGLAELGHTIDLLTYPVGDDVVIPGVTIHRVPRPPFIREIKIGPSRAKLFLDFLLFVQAVKMLVKHRYDVIHSHEEASFFSALLANIFAVRHLYDMHSCLPRQLQKFDFAAYRPVIYLFELLEKWVINSCDAIITIGPDLEQYVKGIRSDVELAMIENLPVSETTGRDSQAVDRLKERLALQGRFPVVYTGNFERYQGINLLLESTKLVIEDHPEVIFLMIGGKPHQVEQWQREVQKHGLEEYVQFLGPVPVTEVNLYQEIAEILVSPRVEGTSVPLKIYSYMWSGKPILATDLPAHSLVLNEDNALLVSPGRETFAAGLVRLIKDPALRTYLGHQARQLAQNKYNPSTYLARLDQLYQTLLPSVYTVKEPLPDDARSVLP